MQDQTPFDYQTASLDDLRRAVAAHRARAPKKAPGTANPDGIRRGGPGPVWEETPARREETPRERHLGLPAPLPGQRSKPRQARVRPNRHARHKRPKQAAEN